MPASPESKTIWPAPAQASRRRARNRALSGARPTRSTSPRRAASKRLSVTATPSTTKASTGAAKPFAVCRPRSVSRKRSPTRRRVAPATTICPGLAGDIVLDNLAAHDDQPGGNPDARLELFALTQLRHPLDQRQPAARGPLGAVLMRLRIAEINQDAVAHVAGDKPAKALGNLCDAAMVSADNPAQIFGVEPHRQGRRGDQIAEHNRQLPPLGGVVRRRTGRGGGRRRCLGGGQTGDGSEETLAVPSDTPSFSRSASVSSGRISASMSLPRNSASYCPRPRLLSQPPTSMFALHGPRTDHPSVAAPCPGREETWLDGEGKHKLT